MILEMVCIFKIIFFNLLWLLFFIFIGEFRHYFEKYGRVMSAEVMFNRETHKSRGFGFIIFDNEESVDRVCEEKDHSIDGKMVII